MYTKPIIAITIGTALIILASMVDALAHPVIVLTGALILAVGGAMLVAGWLRVRKP